MRRAAWCLLAVLLAAVSPVDAADQPAWLQDAARNAPAATAVKAGTGAIVLVDDVALVVADDGRVVSRRRYAALVLNKEGAAAAALREVYTKDAGEIRVLRGWTLARGINTELGKNDIVDIALTGDDVYNEARARVISAVSRAEAGTIFGAESELAERVPFPQAEWLLQGQWPVRLARRSVELPSGWDARSITLNGAPIEPQRSGNTFTWSITDLQPLANEPASPASDGRSRRLAVTYFPAAKASSFDDWTSVSRWLAGLAEPSGAATPDLAAKSRQLTAGAASDLEKIRALAEYVQRVQYISIQLGIGRGGGYTPRPAGLVFTRNYGDCKDKANLLRTMLASVGIRSHLVALFSGDAAYVRAEWPSPQQFNHAILAIAVDTSLPAAKRYEPFGNLLLFDPTNTETPLGELPGSDQGGRGLIIAGSGGSLVTLPEAPPEANRQERSLVATLGADGSLSATIRQVFTGAPAADERYWQHRLTREEYLAGLQAAAAQQIPGAALTLGAVIDDRDRNVFEMNSTLRVARFAQVVQGRLLLVRPPRPLRTTLPALSAAARESPIVLDARDERDTLELELPAGVQVDELPSPVTVATAFGRLTVEWIAAPGHLTRRATLKMARVTLPAEAYSEVRGFLAALREAEDAPAVLRR